MAESQGSPIFEDCVFAFVISRDLTISYADDLRKTLEDHRGEVHDITDDKIDLENVTLILSETSDFPQYAEARLHMVPVVTPSWVTQSLLRNKMAPYRPYTPDPNLIFSNMTLTCADIPNGDKDAIIGAVLAMGGIEVNSLTKLTTHICALTMDHPKCVQAREKGLKCRIVLPHWFDDCLKLGKRIDEKPYMLPDPEILRVGAEEAVDMPDTNHMRGAESPNPDPAKLNRIGESVRQLEVFQGKRVMISDDLEISSRLRAILETLIETGGGSTTKSIRKTDMFVCRWREGRNYVIASRSKIDVGNLSWLFHLIINNEWTSPLRRLLHYPVPKNGIEGFEGTRITLSNYGGEARTYLENLITAAGGEFTKSMKTDNTHLITARKNSEKCDAAAEWNIHMTNHLWLEESYAKCEMQTQSNSRYTHFPPRTNLGEVIGETQFDATILEAKYFSKDPTPSPKPAKRNTMKEKDRNRKSTGTIIPHDEEDNEPEEAMKAPTQRRRTKSTPAMDVSTPVPNRLSSVGKENDNPGSTGSRSAKDKALSRLHVLAPDIALYEKEKKRKGTVWGGERAANNFERQKSLENGSSPIPKRVAEELSGEEETETPNKRQKTGNGLPPVTMRILITGYKEWVGNLAKEEAEKKKLREYGINIEANFLKCTHLAAPAMVRTQKFLCALAGAPIIISTDFIEACTAPKQKEVPNPQDFLLKDKANEKKFGYKLKDILLRAQTNKRKLLAGVLIYCTEKIPSGVETYRSIVEANGGIFNVYNGKPAIKKITPEQDDGPAEPVYLLTGLTPAEKQLWPKFTKNAKEGNTIPRVVMTEWILDVALSQQNKWSDKFLAAKQ